MQTTKSLPLLAGIVKDVFPVFPCELPGNGLLPVFAVAIVDGADKKDRGQAADIRKLVFVRMDYQCGVRCLGLSVLPWRSRHRPAGRDYRYVQNMQNERKPQKTGLDGRINMPGENLFLFSHNPICITQRYAKCMERRKSVFTIVCRPPAQPPASTVRHSASRQFLPNCRKIIYPTCIVAISFATRPVFRG